MLPIYFGQECLEIWINLTNPFMKLYQGCVILAWRYVQESIGKNSFNFIIKEIKNHVICLHIL